MNSITMYLAKNWKRLDLDKYGRAEDLSCVFITPRFQASGHIIAFILSKVDQAPVFVAKIPRLPDETNRLEREVACLNSVQGLRDGGFDSIPRLISYEDWGGTRILIETALPGQPMSPAIVRQDPEGCTESVIAWLEAVQSKSRTSNKEDKDYFQRLIIQPLEVLKTACSASPEDGVLLKKHLTLVDSLKEVDFSLVFEHGDLSSPNILIGQDAEIKVVDWELAEPKGLPAVDLFFFLSYIAFAKLNASDNQAYLKAFEDAFFGDKAWAKDHIQQYAKKMGLSNELLKPLFLQCWSQYLYGLVWRLDDSSTGMTAEPLKDETLQWLHSNRYYLLWEHTLTHYEDLNLA